MTPPPITTPRARLGRPGADAGASGGSSPRAGTARRGSSGCIRTPPRGLPSPGVDCPISDFPKSDFPLSDFPNSVIPLRLDEQLWEARPTEPGDRTVEALKPPGPEVEVDRADRGLDRAPQRPAVLAHQAEQHGPGYLAAKRPTVILGDQADH